MVIISCLYTTDGGENCVFWSGRPSEERREAGGALPSGPTW